MRAGVPFEGVLVFGGSAWRDDYFLYSFLLMP